MLIKQIFRPNSYFYCQTEIKVNPWLRGIVWQFIPYVLFLACTFNSPTATTGDLNGISSMDVSDRSDRFNTGDRTTRDSVEG